VNLLLGVGFYLFLLFVKGTGWGGVLLWLMFNLFVDGASLAKRKRPETESVKRNNAAGQTSIHSIR